MTFEVHPLQQSDIEDIATWRYQGPFRIYDCSSENAAPMLVGTNRYQAIRIRAGALAGFCCFGVEARVPGGDYAISEPDIVDVGVGMQPDLVGRGHGNAFMGAVLHHAAASLSPRRFRVTIALFNLRSARMVERIGFEPTHRFENPKGMEFVQYEWEAQPH